MTVVHSSDQTPSIIISLKPGMTIACGPHQTSFTATGFGWCYGRTIGKRLLGVDFKTGELQPIETTLCGFSDFTIYAESDDGYDLPQLARQRSVITDSTDASIAVQAMFANRVTIDMAYWAACGAPAEITRRVAFSDSDPAGCIITLSDGRRLSEVRGLTEQVPVSIAPLVDGANGHLDPERRILWLDERLVPLIDCPALNLDTILRAQIATAFPDRDQNWAIVSRRAGARMIGASRDRVSSPSFLCEPHARDFYPAGQDIPTAAHVSINVEGRGLVAETPDWTYDAEVALTESCVIAHFDAQSWSHLALRPDRRAQIAAAIRQKFRTAYNITLRGVVD